MSIRKPVIVMKIGSIFIISQLIIGKFVVTLANVELVENVSKTLEIMGVVIIEKIKITNPKTKKIGCEGYMNAKIIEPIPNAKAIRRKVQLNVLIAILAWTSVLFADCEVAAKFGVI